MTEVIALKGLCAGYGAKPIIHDISFSLKKGDILGIVGESGCGKTTLLKSIACLPGFSTNHMAGELSILGKPWLSLSEEERRRLRGTAVAMVFQNAWSSLHPLRRIGVQFRETMAAHGPVDDKLLYDRIEESFKSIGLKDVDRILKSYPFELSGGMGQRVAIALAMLLEPQLLLADEPTSALDTTVQKQVLEELRGLRDAMGTTIVMITHNMGVVRHLADYVAVMKDGCVVEYGPVAEVLNHPQAPYTKQLLAAVPKLVGR